MAHIYLVVSLSMFNHCPLSFNRFYIFFSVIFGLEAEGNNMVYLGCFLSHIYVMPSFSYEFVMFVFVFSICLSFDMFRVMACCVGLNKLNSCLVNVFYTILFLHLGLN